MEVEVPNDRTYMQVTHHRLQNIQKHKCDQRINSLAWSSPVFSRFK